MTIAAVGRRCDSRHALRYLCHSFEDVLILSTDLFARYSRASHGIHDAHRWVWLLEGVLESRLRAAKVVGEDRNVYTDGKNGTLGALRRITGRLLPNSLQVHRLGPQGLNRQESADPLGPTILVVVPIALTHPIRIRQPGGTRLMQFPPRNDTIPSIPRRSPV